LILCHAALRLSAALGPLLYSTSALFFFSRFFLGLCRAALRGFCRFILGFVPRCTWKFSAALGPLLEFTSFGQLSSSTVWAALLFEI
jgi:hypothetical protein